MIGDVVRQAEVGPSRPPPEDRGVDPRRAIGPGVLDAVAEVLAGAAVGRDHHGAAGEGRLERGQPWRLEPARQRENAGRRVGRGQQRVVVIQRAEPADEALPGASARLGVGLVPRRGGRR